MLCVVTVIVTDCVFGVSCAVCVCMYVCGRKREDGWKKEWERTLVLGFQLSVNHTGSPQDEERETGWSTGVGGGRSVLASKNWLCIWLIVKLSNRFLWASVIYLPVMSKKNSFFFVIPWSPHPLTHLSASHRRFSLPFPPFCPLLLPTPNPCPLKHDSPARGHRRWVWREVWAHAGRTPQGSCSASGPPPLPHPAGSQTSKCRDWARGDGGRRAARSDWTGPTTGRWLWGASCGKAWPATPGDGGTSRGCRCTCGCTHVNKTVHSIVICWIVRMEEHQEDADVSVGAYMYTRQYYNMLDAG